MIDIDEEQVLVVTSAPDRIQGPFIPQGYGLVPIGDPTFEEWLAFGENLKNIEKGVHFWIGDWINYGRARWDQTPRYKLAVQQLGFDYRTLRNDAWVASKVEVSRRRDTLSFSHHEEVAPYTPEEQELLLDHAKEQGWSAKKLRSEKARVLANIVQSAPVEEDSSELGQCKILDACPIVDLHKRVKAGILDAIITDPPYPHKYLAVYAELADFAIHALKPGGSLIVMVGQSYLPEIMDMLRKEPLKYHWMACYYVPGSTTKQWQRNIGIAWKPLLWFVNGEYDGPWKKDVIRAEEEGLDSDHIFVGKRKDKKHHKWGQPEEDMVNILEHFTQPNQLICDPFLGGGTTAVASLMCDRRFIGSDIDKQCVQTTRKRVNDVQEMLEESQRGQSA